MHILLGNDHGTEMVKLVLIMISASWIPPLIKMYLSFFILNSCKLVTRHI